ncbi:MAG: type II secretion system protein GspG [Methylacidiphilales bacterium]|nr:type II secretion system protein GspG [Candidatus Methylacidiphilales bacterium]
MNESRGFTMLELVVVMVVVSLLAGAIVPNLLKRPAQARQVAIDQDFQSLQLVISLFALDNGFLPPQSTGLRSLNAYLQRIPKDPWGREYLYEMVSADDYRICTLGADGVVGGEGESIDRCLE